MAYEHKDGQGSLFKNDKGGVEKRPDYKGNLFVNGKLMDLAAWVKEGRNGKWLSISMSERKTIAQAQADNAVATFKTTATEPNPFVPDDNDPGSLPF